MDAAVGALALRVRAPLMRGADEDPGELESALFQLKLRENVGDKLRYCFRIAMTPTVGDWELLHMPPSLPILYYPLRAVRLARKYVPALLSLRRRKPQ
jgi:hypothetical protein